MNVFVIQPHEIAVNWGWVSEFLREVEDPVWGTDDVFTALLEEKAQLWGFSENGQPKGVVVTRLGKIGDTPSGLIWIASGEDLQSFVTLLRETIEPWFKAKGCRWAEINGRRGWKKVLPDYTERTTVFAKEL